MDHYSHIQRALDFIEENLVYDIRPLDIAQIAGYSEYHFLRLFKETVGLTPADYIRKRRISEIVRHMSEEKRPISDIAFAFGFNSKESFIRAFKREHGILPTEFRKTQNSLKLYDRVILCPSSLDIPAKLVTLSPFSLTVFPIPEISPPQFWNQYNTQGLSKLLSGGRIVEDFGVSDWNPHTRTLSYYIGIRTCDTVGEHAGTVTLFVPGGTYALFETPPATQYDFVNMIHRTWDYIGKIWLKENGYRRTGGYELESYTERSRLFSEHIYIPVVKERMTNHEKTECDF